MMEATVKSRGRYQQQLGVATLPSTASSHGGGNVVMSKRPPVLKSATDSGAGMRTGSIVRKQQGGVKGGGGNNSLECPICLESYKHATTTRCGHSFCFHCLFLSTITHCPLCRHPPGLSALRHTEYLQVARSIWATFVTDGDSVFPQSVANVYFSSGSAFSDFEADELLQLRSRVAKLATTSQSASPNSKTTQSSLLLREPDEYLAQYRSKIVAGFLSSIACSSGNGRGEDVMQQQNTQHGNTTTIIPPWPGIVSEATLAPPNRRIAAEKQFLVSVEEALRTYETTQGRLLRATMGKKLAHHHSYDENTQQQMFFDGGLMWRRAPSLVMGKVRVLDHPTTTTADRHEGSSSITPSSYRSSRPPLPTSARHHLSPLAKNKKKLTPRGQQQSTSMKRMMTVEQQPSPRRTSTTTQSKKSKLSGHLAHLLNLEKNKGSSGPADPFADDEDEDDNTTAGCPTPRPGSRSDCGRNNNYNSHRLPPPHPSTPQQSTRGDNSGVQLVTPRGKQWTCLPNNNGNPTTVSPLMMSHRHSAPTFFGRGGTTNPHVLPLPTSARGSTVVPPLLPTTTTMISLRPGSAALNQQDDDLMLATRHLAKLRSQVLSSTRNPPPPLPSNMTTNRHNPRQKKKLLR